MELSTAVATAVAVIQVSGLAGQGSRQIQSMGLLISAEQGLSLPALSKALTQK